MKHPRQNVFEIDRSFMELWDASGVEDAYLDLVDERIYELIDNLYTYDPDLISLAEYKASVEMLAYTTTELLAQLCAGGFRWLSTDKARFLSPTVDLETVIRSKIKDDRGLGHYFDALKLGTWEFLEVSDDTNSWIEAQKLDKEQVSYLLFAAKWALELLKADERIPGFTSLALLNPEILDGYCKFESPIESILYMQLVVDGLRPPALQNQWHIEQYRVDFAIPSHQIVIECDSKKYHDTILDALRDVRLHDLGWAIIRFPAELISRDPALCSEKVHDVYPWQEESNPL